jgi:hypothetical protein
MESNTTTDWSELTIKLQQLAAEREKALNDKHLGKAIALHGQILDLNSELTIWLKEAYK